jgi:hypothetical protein
MSELDAGNEQAITKVSRKPVGAGKGGDGEYVAYSPDRHADVVQLPPMREG